MEQIEFADLKKMSGLKNRAISRLLEINEGHISRILNGKGNPSDTALELFREKLKNSSQPSETSGVIHPEPTTKRGVLPPAGKGEMYLSEEQPGGKISPPEAVKIFEELELLRVHDPSGYRHAIETIHYCAQRLHDAEKKKK